MKKLLALLLFILPLWASAQSNSIYFQRSSEWMGTYFERWSQGVSIERNWRERPYTWSLSLQHTNVNDKMGWNYERVLPLFHTDSTFSFYKGQGAFKELDVRLGFSNFHTMGMWKVYMKAEFIAGRTQARFQKWIETYTYNEALGAYEGRDLSMGTQQYAVQDAAGADVTYRKLGCSLGSGTVFRITQTLEARAGVKMDMHTRWEIDANNLGKTEFIYPKALPLKSILQLEWGLGVRF